MRVLTPIQNLVMIILCFLLCNYPSHGLFYFLMFFSNVTFLFMFLNVCLYTWFLTGPDGDFRLYLERLVEAQNVQEYVSQHPFGQRTIMESDPSWVFIVGFCKC